MMPLTHAHGRVHLNKLCYAKSLRGGHQDLLRVGAMELSDNAKKLLKYFHDRNLREMDYEYPSAMEKLFEYDLEACEIAQEELAKGGLLELGSPRLSYEILGVRSAALTTRRRAISTRENRELVVREVFDFQTH